ncbi:MAG: hypothetical protein JXR46_00880 [Calditrichaceae bacterium]|nr:hypothetical protein [Calditrichaceae bacterium]
MSRILKNIIHSIILIYFLFGIIQAQNRELELNNLHHSQLHMAGFQIKSDKIVNIKAVGSGADKAISNLKNPHADISNMYAYAWIINAKSRKMVWRMTVDNTRQKGWSDLSREFDGSVHLDAGIYEVYFSAVEPEFWNTRDGFFSFKNLLEKLLQRNNDWENQAREWMLKISNIDGVFDAQEIKKIKNKLKGKIIIDLTEIRNKQEISSGFTLKEPAKLNIYAIGEGFDDKMYDYGWIINADTWKKVWSMEEDETEHAGGAAKNRMINEDIEFEAGSYLVKYTSDGSHSYEKWNSNPPYDPAAWGIIVRPGDDKDFDPSICIKLPKESVQPIISLTKIGDYAYKEQMFSISRPTRLRIYALGEGRSGDMFDYAWITNAQNGKIVWKMEYKETKHAGGASKNRLFEDIIKLDSGEYIVHYQSDDSHSYEEWNNKKPQNPEMWGITLYPVGDRNAISLEAEEKVRNNIIAQIVRVGDDEHIRKEFYIDEKTEVRVYCIGEGDSDEMYDYGWIEQAETGRKVWKMKYKHTDHAGGAQKNRVADKVITLEEGKYRIHYRSDDSHSFYEWNDKAPYDQKNWGITLYKID